MIDDSLNDLLRRAEDRPSDKTEPPVSLSVEQTHELVHALRTHQIELELQNEELRNAQRELAESRERYISLYDFAPVGYATVSGKGIIQQANLTLTEMLNVPRKKLVGRRLSALVVPEDGDSFYRYFRGLSAVGLKRSCELRLRRGGGGDHCIWVLLESVILPEEETAEGAAPIRCTFSDITEYTQAKVMVAAVDAMREGVVLMQLDGTIISVNPAMERLTGLTRGDLVGSTLESLLSGTLQHDDLGMLLAAFTDIRAGKATTLKTVVLSTGDGKCSYVMPSVAFITLPGVGTETAVLTLSDVTDQVTFEQELTRQRHELRALASQLSLAQEHERRRLATELHDQCGQTLTLARLKLQMLGEHVTGEGGTCLHREALGLISQASDHVRTFTFELSPPVLYKVGLGAALEWLGERFERQYGVRTTCESFGNWRGIPETTSVLLFQSARELLANVGKHAQARNVHVSLATEAGKVTMAVTDDGVGFDARAASAAGPAKQSFGLFSIRERVHHIGGSVDIQSKPGQGATLTLLTPIGATTEDPVD